MYSNLLTYTFHSVSRPGIALRENGPINCHRLGGSLNAGCFLGVFFPLKLQHKEICQDDDPMGEDVEYVCRTDA